MGSQGNKAKCVPAITAGNHKRRMTWKVMVAAAGALQDDPLIELSGRAVAFVVEDIERNGARGAVPLRTTGLRRPIRGAGQRAVATADRLPRAFRPVNPLPSRPIRL